MRFPAHGPPGPSSSADDIARLTLRLVRELLTLGEKIMAAIDDLNAKIAEVGTKIETVGSDLAAEIAALAAANNNPATGTPDAAIADSISKLQALSDRLSAIASTMPATPPAA